MMAADPSLFQSAVGRQALAADAKAYVERSMAMMGRARALVVHDRIGALPLLRARRDTLGRHFGRFQRFKHGCIFDPVIAHGTASSRVVAHTMKIDCMALGEEFGAYCQRWLHMHRDEWPIYRRNMMETVDFIAERLDSEHRAIRQLLMISDLYRGSPRKAAQAA